MADISKITPLGSSTTYNLKDNNAPRKDGTGATGTWGINISGSAALNVLKTGDTMSGTLTISTGGPTRLNLKNTDMDFNRTTLPSATEYNEIYCIDKNGYLGGYIQQYQNSAGRTQFQLGAVNRNSDSSAYIYNLLSLGIDADGTRTVSVTTPATWRSALGVVNKAGDTMTGQLHINMTNDVGGTTAPGTTAPLVIGAKDGQHMEIDNNEILSKSDGTTPGTLYLQDGSGIVSVAGTGGLKVTAGLLAVTKNSNTITIGSQNSSFCHIYNSANIPFIFNKNVQVIGSFQQYTDAVTSSSWIKGRDSAALKIPTYNSYHAGLSMKTTNGSWEVGVYTNDNLWFTYASDTNYNNNTNTVAQTHIASGGQVYGAVWNDYAEYRITKNKIEPGRCVIETGNDDLILSTKRMQPGAEIVSDTFGFAIGETKEAKTPIASNGRVLAYPYESLEEFKKNIGRPVCSGPNGTISIMTDEEYQRYGYCAIGTISAVPDYEEWGTGKVKVNGRVWIRIR